MLPLSSQIRAKSGSDRKPRMPASARGYTLTLSKKPTGGDSINLKIKGKPSDDAVEKITRLFKSKTLVSLDEVQIVTEIGEVPLLVDLRVN